MLYASDDEQSSAVVAAASAASVSQKLAAVLRRECSCQRKICLSQFQHAAPMVEAKRAEFELLQPLEKAMVLARNGLCSLEFTLACVAGSFSEEALPLWGAEFFRGGRSRSF